jgi:hypothetical protein
LPIIEKYIDTAASILFTPKTHRRTMEKTSLLPPKIDIKGAYYLPM